MGNKIFVGSEIKEIFSFSQDDVDLFAKLSKDFNPIHLNDEYSKKTIFGRKIIHGFLGSSIFSKIIGMQLPGEGSIYLKQNLKFLKPMYVDNHYTAKVSILEIDYKKHRVVLETKITDSENNDVVSGDALVQNNIIKDNE